jgi:hypothetical protein
LNYLARLEDVGEGDKDADCVHDHVDLTGNPFHIESGPEQELVDPVLPQPLRDFLSSSTLEIELEPGDARRQPVYSCKLR